MHRAVATACVVPHLPGTQVAVMLGDMSGGAMMAGGAGMMGRGGSDPMMLRISPQAVSARTVSIAVFNHGSRTHELVILPLSADAPAGSRNVGAGDVVSEAGSLGEASLNCGSDSGEGIAAGSAGWVTLTLAPGRYELLCNLPGHYAAGMYAELDVS